MLERIKAWLGIFPEFGGIGRSSKWPTVRKMFLSKFPKCAVCGTNKDCEVHHKVPYHIDKSLELVPSNFITLCRPHHYLFGHLMNWASFNVNCELDAKLWSAKIKDRP